MPIDAPDTRSAPEPLSRRRPGEVVVKIGGAGFNGDEFLAIILNDGEPDDCFTGCAEPGCVEWPTLRELDGLRRHAFHVSECEMATPAASQLRRPDPARTTRCMLCGRFMWANASVPALCATALATGDDCRYLPDSTIG